MRESLTGCGTCTYTCILDKMRSLDAVLTLLVWEDVTFTLITTWTYLYFVLSCFRWVEPFPAVLSFGCVSPFSSPPTILTSFILRYNPKFFWRLSAISSECSSPCLACVVLMSLPWLSPCNIKMKYKFNRAPETRRKTRKSSALDRYWKLHM